MTKTSKLIPQEDFLKSLKKGDFVLLLYTGNAVRTKPSIALIKKINRSGFMLNVFNEGGGWDSFVNAKGISYQKNDTWAKVIAPVSELGKHLRRINKYRKDDGEEKLSLNQLKQKYFDLITKNNQV